MRILLCLLFSFFLFTEANARRIYVQDLEALHQADAAALPGDTIIMRNGEWKDVRIKLEAKGTSAKPIVYKAETRGRVLITGSSDLKIGGHFLVIDGLYFTKGSAPGFSLVEFRTGPKQTAQNCRLTQTVIDDFNKEDRMKQDQWIALYGKNNRVDHCRFTDKKNMGVVMAVLLDDEQSRENHHLVQYNYFGRRLPLGSNGGEIIRVGLSQHAQYNSNTRIMNNVFEHCDGEAEIISIKSGGNFVEENLFSECQGSVVLRHGDHNTVSNNIFLGNGKEGTGGVRIVNQGQWVINNLFYKCRGAAFRAPLSIMNGIPNSPANRYVQVRDAVILNNSFVDCAPLSFGEGSDAERSLAPEQLLFAGNIFYNSKDTAVFLTWDKLDGFRFLENQVNQGMEQELPAGFEKKYLPVSRINGLSIPSAGRGTIRAHLDSLKKLAPARLPSLLPAPGFSSAHLIKKFEKRSQYGTSWAVPAPSRPAYKTIICTGASCIEAALARKERLIIQLSGGNFHFTSPLEIRNDTRFTTTSKSMLRFSSDSLASIFTIRGKSRLELDNLVIDADKLKAFALISTDKKGSPEHYQLVMKNVEISHLENCSYLFYSYPSVMADSIVVRDSKFTGLAGGFNISGEKENRGLYNVEKMILVGNRFSNGKGVLLHLYRGGSDESTLGPDLHFDRNQVSQYNAPGGEALMKLTGVQKSRILHNSFADANKDNILLIYRDGSRARHVFKLNRFTNAGRIEKNEFVLD